jgi:hypothetical protein
MVGRGSNRAVNFASPLPVLDASPKGDLAVRPELSLFHGAHNYFALHRIDRLLPTRSPPNREAKRDNSATRQR